jgi:tetratricopeptide (TPR) repeat protein
MPYNPVSDQHTSSASGSANADVIDLDTIISHIEWRYSQSSKAPSPIESILTNKVLPNHFAKDNGSQATEAPRNQLLIANGGSEIARSLVQLNGLLKCIEPTSEQAEFGRQCSPGAAWIHRKLFDYVGLIGAYDVCFVWLLPNLAPPYLLIDLFSSWKYLTKDDGVLIVAAVTSSEPSAQWSSLDVTGSTDEIRPVYVSILPVNHLASIAKQAGLEVYRTSIEPLNGLRESGTDEYLEVIEARRRPGTRLNDPTWPPQISDLQLDDPASYSSLSEMLEQGINKSLEFNEDKAFERVNRSIALDVLAAINSVDGPRFRTYAERLHQSLFIPNNDEPNFDVWWSLGSLFHKTGEYEYAVRCLDKACELRPDDYRPFLRRGYCLEALLRFTEAIESGLESKLLLERAANQESLVNSEEMAEISHALGHFYASSSHIGRLEPDEADFSRGLTHMIKACASGDVGLDYVSCVGSMFSEREQYQLALFWFGWAAGRLPAAPEDSRMQEVEFYRAVALLGAGNYEDALNVLEEMERWAARAGDWDAKSHGVLYRAKAHIASLGLDGFNGNLLRRLLREVEDAPPSRYVVGGVRRDRSAFIEYMRGSACLDDIASNDLSLEEAQRSLNLAIEHLGRAVEISGAKRCRVRIYCLDSTDTSLEHLRREFDLAKIPHATTPTARSSPWLPTVNPGVSVFIASPGGAEDAAGDLLWILGALSVDEGLIVWDRYGDISNSIGLDHSKWCLENFKDAAGAAIATALFRSCLEHFAYFETPLGLAPIVGAPSRLAIQAGAVAFISTSGKSQ